MRAKLVELSKENESTQVVLQNGEDFFTRTIKQCE